MTRHWQACASRLEQELTPQLFKTWIKPLVFLDYDEGERVLRLAAPNRFKLDWIRSQFGQRIAELAAAEIHPRVRVQFEVRAPLPPPGSATDQALEAGPATPLSEDNQLGNGYRQDSDWLAG